MMPSVRETRLMTVDGGTSAADFATKLYRIPGRADGLNWVYGATMSNNYEGVCRGWSFRYGRERQQPTGTYVVGNVGRLIL